MSEVEQLALWKVLVDKGTDEQRQTVRALVNYAAPILDRIIETFPTYTLHDSTHARNVAKLMADLLGERIQDLTPLEAAFLILSAYWHDIGMVFKEDERARLTDEPEWADFLQEHAEAYLAVKGDAEADPPSVIAEWYCRWRHADRVFAYLNRAALEGISFKWGVVDLREALGNLCRSHNEGVERIQANAILKTNYLGGGADLRFCAILLRLADILDFDRTRSPESVYRYLGLKRRADRREHASDVEWRKHLAADGFVFPDDRSPGYLLDFVAGPDRPAVEYDLRQFLGVIEGEIEQCTALLPACSKHRRNLPLPARIRRDGIVANGYRYGEYRFSLDQPQVLDLLMGENLYDDPYVFVRELLQNAIDASRLREQFQRFRGRADFCTPPIRVSQWQDRDGYHWIRFDDSGTGMDEQIIRTHLLTIGSSYYNSPGYRADILRASGGAGSDFVPISRFGVGLLSCFMVGDRVEIATLRQLPDGTRGASVRLSIQGVQGFYTLQTPELPPAPMPSSSGRGMDYGYRLEPGTSIAVRLDPAKDPGYFNAKRLLEHHLLCPPIPVEFDGQRIGGDPGPLLEHPWCAPLRVQLTAKQLSSLSELLELPLTSQDIGIYINPIDLTNYSPDPKLRGQMLLARLRLSECLTSNFSFYPSISFTDTLAVQVVFAFKCVSREMPERLERHMLFDIGVATAVNKEINALNRCNQVLITHNGITLQSSPMGDKPSFRVEMSDINTKNAAVCGIIAFYDYLRPELSISRDALRGLPWSAYSATNLALSNVATKAGISKSWGLSGMLSPCLLSREPSLEDLIKDPHLQSEEGWVNCPLYEVGSRWMSLKEVLRERERGLIIRLAYIGRVSSPYRHGSDFIGLCQSTLLQMYADLTYIIGGETYGVLKLRVEDRRRTPMGEVERKFRPLAFVRFEGENVLRLAGSPINRSHKFACWMLTNGSALALRYPSIFQRISEYLMVDEYLTGGHSVGGINNALERLHELGADLAPPRNLFLQESDFGRRGRASPANES